MAFLYQYKNPNRLIKLEENCEGCWGIASTLLSKTDASWNTNMPVHQIREKQQEEMPIDPGVCGNTSKKMFFTIIDEKI